jgi:hypothetical protein
VNTTDSVAAKVEGHGFTASAPAFEGKTTTELGEGGKATLPVTSTARGKRKRVAFSEDDMLERIKIPKRGGELGFSKI